MIRSQKYNGFTQQKEGSFAPLPHCGTPTVLYGPHFGPSSVVGTTKALAVCQSSFSCGLGLAWLFLRGYDDTAEAAAFFVLCQAAFIGTFPSFHGVGRRSLPRPPAGALALMCFLSCAVCCGL